jgi:phage anti-repressor protein
METSQVVELAVQSTDFQENTLDHVKLAKIAGFNQEEVEFVKLFWDPAFNDSWIYITKEMVVEWLGYSNAKDTMRHFYKKLIDNYENNVDFKEVDKNDVLVIKSYSENFANEKNEEKLGNRAKYYTITGECLKAILMSAQTMRGKVIRKIYIKTEKLVFIMLKVINRQQLLLKDTEIKTHQAQIAIKDKLLIEATTINLKLDNKVLNIKPYTNNGFVYLATNDIWSKSNVFRLGRTEDINNRIKKYENGRVIEEKLYFVFFFETRDLHTLEYLLRANLSKFREDPKKDQYILHPSILLPLVRKICNLFNNSIMTMVNNAINENIEIAVAPVILEKVIYNKDNVVVPQQIENAEDTIETTPTKQEYKQELLMSEQEIDNFPNEQTRSKARRRNIFITKMSDLNFRVISTYKTTEHTITLICPLEHTFNIIPNNHNLDSVVCHICDNVVKTLEATKLVADRGMKCLDYKEKRFRCAKGHDFIACNLNYTLHRNGGCAECSKRSRLTKQDHFDVATSNGGTWVDNGLNEPPSSHFPTSWICDKGHAFQSKYQNAYKYWSSQCLICNSSNITEKYTARVLEIIKIYPNATLVTKKFLGVNDNVVFKCTHRPDEWSVILRGFLLKLSWKCSKCRNEQISPDASSPLNTSNTITINNQYYTTSLEVVNKYHAEITSPIEDITRVTSNIDIKCEHKSWSTQVKAITLKDAWNCIKCKNMYGAEWVS